MLNIKATHPDYDNWIDAWQLMRDAYDVEAVQQEGEKYLPRPSGFSELHDPDEAYRAYKNRAEVPDLLAPTVRGMVGVMHRKEASIELPEALEPLRERATRDGLTLDALHRRINRELLQTGRYGLLGDIRSGGAPYIAGYTAESIRNWDEDEEQNLDFLVLDESAPARSQESGEWHHQHRYRKLEMVGGTYQATIHEQNASGSFSEGDPVEALGPGRRALDFIPFVFVNTNDLTPQPEEVPLYGVAKAVVAVYRLDADHRRLLFLTANPQHIVTGVHKDDAPGVIGGGLWVFEDPSSDAKILEFTGAGSEAFERKIQAETEKAIEVGARLMQDGQESGEALRIRMASQTATLTSIAKSAAAGLERVLRHLALWVGANPDEVVVTPNLEFFESVLSTQEVRDLVEAWQKQGMSFDSLFHNMKKGGRVPEDRTPEEEIELIEQQGPVLGFLGRD